MIPLGQKEMMKIWAYKDSTCQELKNGENTFEVQVNPESYATKYKIDYADIIKAGKKGADPKYIGLIPNEWDFEVVIDGTGAIKKEAILDVSITGRNKRLEVEDEVKKLKKVVLNYDGEFHKSPYLKVAWGDTKIFKGTLVKLDFDYKLFKPDGTPLRVIAKFRLRKWIDPELGIREENAQSPDITHERVFVGDNRIDLMSEKIYDTSDYYIDVARANDLNSFRRIKIGQKLEFPPLK